ncbi:SOS response-associated peptidase family protein [Enorma massiliensis]|uniref:SOS response-associated peptidase family protein n=1 Tax=Enorma massiliensis TaxID=1472761 RepID=UPI002E7A3421|nr:SOS response-associated peptidase family protein [Enorma massiliensis]
MVADEQEGKEAETVCVRFSPLTAEEAQAVLDARGTGRHGIRFIERPDPIHDARPGSTVPLFVPDSAGSLKVAKLEWGFPLDGRPNAVFNTRIESALEQRRRGRRGMWAKAIAEGRCLVPVRAFYESSATERVTSEKTGRPVRRQYRFHLPGARAFLLAAVQQDGRFSIVTTEPNASVAPIHDRMPLVLGPGESSMWLGEGFATLKERGSVSLVCKPERVD